MKIFRYYLLSLLFVVSLIGATNFLNEILQMYENDTLKENLSAIHYLEQKANEGDSNATFLLATAYKNGKLGKIDLAQSYFWYKKLALKGDADAMLMLGWLHYKNKTDLKTNLKKAKYWFKKAAAQGIDEAIEMLKLLDE